ncbi:MAG: fumarylacetoacetase [Rhizobacter sp.]|nr:fumarylacetoacetase [Burkholderiales bacterium]
MTALNETHAPTLKSFVVSANDGITDFPIQNLPFAVFRRAGSDEPFRGGVAIGDQIVDLARLHRARLLSDVAAAACEAATATTLNALMAHGNAASTALRLALSRLLRVGSAHQAEMLSCFVAQSDAEYALPAHIGDYTDFYTSIHHATNIGRQFRPDNPLLPNYKWVPIGYHGRASSIAISGQSFPRPVGQLMPPGAEAPTLAPCKRMDFELEMGIFVGSGNALGTRIGIDDAQSHVFGLCLLNDWSARDIQGWEYQPLGPFLSKNFASTISPWIVTLEALAPYRQRFTRASDDPQPLPYLDSAALRSEGAFDIQLEVLIETALMREQRSAPHRICLTSYRHAYWTVSQLVTHHTVNGCNLQPGDLLGTGTLSGPTASEAGALIELTQGGKLPITLPNGESRAFLADGDSITLRAHCEKSGAARIGFGTCTGTVLPALPL